MIERLLIKDKNQCSSARKTCSIKSFASQQGSGKYSLEIACDVTETSLAASKSCLWHLICLLNLLSCQVYSHVTPLTGSSYIWSNPGSVLPEPNWLNSSAAVEGSLSHSLPDTYFSLCMWQRWQKRGLHHHSEEMVLHHFKYCWYLWELTSCTREV